MSHQAPGELQQLCRLCKSIIAKSPRIERLGSPEPSCTAPDLRTSAIVKAIRRSLLYLPTMYPTPYPSGLAGCVCRYALYLMASHSCTTVQPGPSSPKDVATAGVNFGSRVRRLSSTCFLITYNRGLSILT